MPQPTVYMTAEEDEEPHNRCRKKLACVSNLRAPSNDSDLLDPLERLREQREQVPPAAHDVLRHENRSQTKQIKS